MLPLLFVLGRLARLPMLSMVAVVLVWQVFVTVGDHANPPGAPIATSFPNLDGQIVHQGRSHSSAFLWQMAPT